MTFDDFKGLFLSMWRHETGVLYSPHSPKRCAEILKSRIDPPLALFGSRDAIGHVNRNGGSFSKRIFYGNSFRTQLRLSFEERGTGTRVRWTAGPSVFATAFMSLWFGFLGLWTVTAIPLAASEPTTLAIFLGGGLVMITLGTGFVTFARWLARNEQPFLVAFTANALNAERSDRSPA